MEEAEISFVIHPSQKEMLQQKAGAGGCQAPKANFMFLCARITILIILSFIFVKVLSVWQVSIFTESKINFVHCELEASWTVKTENHSSFWNI